MSNSYNNILLLIQRSELNGMNGCVGKHNYQGRNQNLFWRETRISKFWLKVQAFTRKNVSKSKRAYLCISQKQRMQPLKGTLMQI